MQNVTVITPTKGRPEYLKKCIEGFLAQDYPNKWMVIIADDYKADIPADWYFKLCIEKCVPISLITHKGTTIGTKRNIGCGLAGKNDIILHMDDDDYYHPEWISKSVAFLEHSGADLTGLNSAYFANNDHKWQYIYQPPQPFVMGATMCYRKSLWERNKFPDKQVGEDNAFCANAGIITSHSQIDLFCATIHDNNTSPKNTKDSRVFRQIS